MPKRLSPKRTAERRCDDLSAELVQKAKAWIAKHPHTYEHEGEDESYLKRVYADRRKGHDDHWSDYPHRVRQYKVVCAKLAKKAGVSGMTINRLLKGERLAVVIMIQIGTALGMRLSWSSRSSI